jgi:hypothetical protein
MIAKVSSLLLTALAAFYSLFWFFAFANFFFFEHYAIGFITINTSQISVVVNLGFTSFLIHIGTIEIFLLSASLATFFAMRRKILETFIFLFATTFLLEVGTGIWLPQYFDYWVTSVQVFWHLPLVTNKELFYSSIVALETLVPARLIQWRLRKHGRSKTAPTSEKIELLKEERMPATTSSSA